MFCRIPLHPLDLGKFAMVDKEDYPLVSQYKWHYLGQGRNEYAYASIKNKNVRMHRLILGVEGETQVDHISGNGLNNCRSNLRLCNNTQNQQNARKTLRKTPSKYKGVTWHPEYKKSWQARIQVHSCPIQLGFYATQAEAALAYNEAAVRYFGEFARLNDVKPSKIKAQVDPSQPQGAASFKRRIPF